ncbi:unnamed protein product [Penicillium salamii]|nr:unnamed protein product [Penicillium salamii]CAG8098856.1 unnamed protein product [Penicillium salamii]
MLSYLNDGVHIAMATQSHLRSLGGYERSALTRICATFFCSLFDVQENAAGSKVVYKHPLLVHQPLLCTRCSARKLPFFSWIKSHLQGSEVGEAIGENLASCIFHLLIGHPFKSSNLLLEALHPTGTAPSQGNKRLALVGNSILSSSLLDQWYNDEDNTGTFDLAPRACAQSTHLKKEAGHKLLKKEACNANLSLRGKEFGLDHYMKNNTAHKGKVPSGTRATTVEALLGAVWIDSGKNMDEVDRVRAALDLGT